jgi:peptidoglycan-N-acetylglucosamine deacetylase
MTEFDLPNANNEVESSTHSKTTLNQIQDSKKVVTIKKKQIEICDGWWGKKEYKKNWARIDTTIAPFYISTKNVPDNTTAKIDLYLYRFGEDLKLCSIECTITKNEIMANTFYSVENKTTSNSNDSINIIDFKKTLHLHNEQVYRIYFIVTIDEIEKSFKSFNSATLFLRPTQIVYLTYDDGPNSGTMNVYNTVKTKEFKATFFLIGSNIDATTTTVVKTLGKDSDIEIANHCQTHLPLVMYNGLNKNIVDNYQDGSQSISNALEIKKEYKKIRFPGNNTWRVRDISQTSFGKRWHGLPTWASKDEANLLASKGYSIFGWDLEWKGPGKITESPDVVIQNIKNNFDENRTKTRNKLILLAHDAMFSSKNDQARLDYMLSKLKEYEYITDTISNY